MSHYNEANTIMGAVANEPTINGHGGGKTYPGAVVPFGMVQLSPDTITGGDNGAGYSYGHKTIEGFSFVHMSGIGWYGEFGNIQTMPISGPRRYFSGTNEYAVHPIGELAWASHFDHDGEVTRPGYYAVTLTDYDIRTEATAARHTGALRFTFGKSGPAHVMIDLFRRIGGHSNEQELTVVDSRTLHGRILCTPAGGGWGHGLGHAHYELHFVSTFSRPMDGWAFWDEGEVYDGERSRKGVSLGFAADFDVAKGEQIEFHTAISFVDMAGALNNFAQEDAPFDELHSRARTEWEHALDTIDVDGGLERDREVFYSSLYHVLLDPRDFSDCDGRYRAAMREPRRIGDFTFRTIFSGWDVFRSTFQLFTLIRPDVVSDELNSLMEISRLNDGAPFARWEIVGIESGCMVGDPGANILGDFCAKGLPGLDAEAAYAICRRWWLGDRQDQGELRDYHRLGYLPGKISHTLEYAFTAWCLHKAALTLGHDDDAQALKAKSLYYRNIFDASAGWMNCRDADGRFNEFTTKYDQRGCVESNICQQTWFVPHDILGLRTLMGEERFDRELDEFFEKADLSAFWNDDYNHSNEPVHTVPHIFVRTGRPHKTQYWVRRIQKEAYRPGPYGYCGNEDVGQMSAWLVLTAMGMHQSMLGSNVFELNTPLFPRVSLRLTHGCHSCAVADTLTISTDCDPETHVYIAGVTLNGVELDRAWITWDELSAGGELVYRLSEAPTDFGAANLPANGI